MNEAKREEGNEKDDAERTVDEERPKSEGGRIVLRPAQPVKQADGGEVGAGGGEQGDAGEDDGQERPQPRPDRRDISGAAGRGRRGGRR